MKHIKTYENYTKVEIAYMLKKASDNNDIHLKTSVKDVMKYLNNFNIGSFEFFVLKNPNDSVSIGNQEKERVDSFIKRFKELGIDTTKLEQSNKGYMQKIIKLEDLIGEYEHNLSFYENDEEDEREMKDEIIRLEKEIDRLTPKSEAHKKELIRLKKQAERKLML